jgi:hypothetical protein
MKVKSCRPKKPAAFSPLPPFTWNIPGTCFCQRLSRSQCHDAAGRKLPMTWGIETCDLPPCSAVIQSTAPQHNHFVCSAYSNFRMDTCRYVRNLTVATIPDFVVVWVKTLCANQKSFGYTCCHYFPIPKKDSYNKSQRDRQLLKFIW